MRIGFGACRASARRARTGNAALAHVRVGEESVRRVRARTDNDAGGRPALTALRRCARGNIAVEFALTVPILLLLMLGSVEMGRFVLLHQKMDRVATTVSDLVSRAKTINESQIADIFTAVGQVAEPFHLADLGVVIVSAITNTDGNGAVIAWQRTGGGVYAAASALGLPGAAPALPGDFQVREGETAIISEVYYDFSPFLSELIVEPQVIYRTAHFRPRLGTLESVTPG